MRLLFIIPGLVAFAWASAVLITALVRAGALYEARLDTPSERLAFAKQLGWAALGFCGALTALNSLAS